MGHPPTVTAEGTRLCTEEHRWTWVLWAGVGLAAVQGVNVFSVLQPRWIDVAHWFPWPGPHFLTAWGAHLLRAAAAVLFFLSAPGWGRLIYRWVNAPEPALPVMTALGLVFWALAGLAAAAAGLSRPEELRILSVLFIAIGCAAAPVRRLVLPRPRGIPFWMSTVIFLFFFLTTIVPDTFYDALVYHLAVPQAYLQAGRWVDLRDSHLTRLPGMAQMIYLWGLAWSDDRLCKLLNLGIGCGIAATVTRLARTLSGGHAGSGIGLAFLSAPVVGLAVWSCSSDALCAFFLLTGFLIMLTPTPSNASAFLGGLLWGAATATRYSALFLAPLGITLLLSRPRLVFPLLAGFLLPLLPWWTRNALWTGNPFYPFAVHALGGDHPDNIAQLASWAADARGGHTWPSRAAAFLTQGLWGAASGRFGFTGPLFLFWACAALLRGKTTAPHRGLWMGWALSYLFFSFYSSVLRFFIPGLGILAALAAAGGLPLWPSRLQSQGQRRVAVLSTFLVAANGMAMAWSFGRFHEGWNVVWGQRSAADHLRMEHPGSYPAPSQGAFDHLRHTGAHGRLLIIGDGRTFRSPLPAVATGAFNTPPWIAWMEQSATATEFQERLTREGFTHLLVNAAELRRVVPRAFQAPEKKNRLTLWLREWPPPEYQDAWCALYKITPQGPQDG